MSARAFTIYDLLARGATLYRDTPALIQGTRQWSFRQLLERASPTMMVADASTLSVVGEWPRAQRGVAHWYQLGEAPPAPGFTALSSLYRDGPPPAVDVDADDPFAVISTAAVDVIPRGAVLTHANVVTASLVIIHALGFTAADRY